MENLFFIFLHSNSLNLLYIFGNIYKKLYIFYIFLHFWKNQKIKSIEFKSIEKRKQLFRKQLFLFLFNKKVRQIKCLKKCR